MDEEESAIIQRIFSRAVMKLGSAAHLAETLDVTLTQLRGYLEGKDKPSDAVLLRVVEMVIEELPAIRTTFSRKAWNALIPPKG